MAQLTSHDVREWIKNTATGEFHYTKILDGQVSKEAYDKLRKIMYDLCHAVEPVVESVGKKDGYYRPIQDLPEPVIWQDLPEKRDFPIVLPFDLRKYVFIYPNTVSIVAGSKSAGKTAFLLRTVVLNMNHIPVTLLSNLEGGREQLRDRFASMDIQIPTPAPFRVIEAHDHFHDFIKDEGTLYVVDYVDVPEGSEFYMIGAQITKIRRKLRNSIAIIGLQKPSMRDTAFGGEATLKDATLYLAMDKNKLKIVDAKVPADPKILPNNMSWKFHMKDGGTNFEYIEPQQMELGEEEP